MALVNGVSHPFHVSTAESELNAKSGHLEVALKVHPADLETAIQPTSGAKLDIDKPLDSEKAIVKYVKSSFQVLVPDKNGKKKPLPVKWLGYEVTVKEAWLYFEIPVRGKLDGLEFRDVLFFETLKDQVNTIHIRVGKKRASMRFSRRVPRHIFDTSMLKLPVRSKNKERSSQSENGRTETVK